MKKLELKRGVVFYGTISEIEQAAHKNEVMLPNDMKKLKVGCNYGADGKLFVFILQPEKEEDKESLIQMAEEALLLHAFLQVSGEEISEEDCLCEAEAFLASARTIRNEL